MTKRILIVEDSPTQAQRLRLVLTGAGYEVEVAANGREGLVKAEPTRVDLVISDVTMPEMDGFEFCRAMKSAEVTRRVPIILLTALASPADIIKGLEAGADNFIPKPYDNEHLLNRVGRIFEQLELRGQQGLEMGVNLTVGGSRIAVTANRHQITELLFSTFEKMSSQHDQLVGANRELEHARAEADRLTLELGHHNEVLEQLVRSRTRDLDQARLETLERLALAAEYRDDDTHEHAQRVGRSAALIAAALDLPAEDVELIRRAAPLHDIGKIGVSDTILLKPGKLSAHEFEVMKTHTTMGAEILAGSGSRVLQLSEQISLSHHERCDGKGYPHGLAGEEIPLIGRLVAIADVFDALTHRRPYKEAWPLDAAVAEIRVSAGRHLDPRLVEIFEALDLEALLAPVLGAAFEDAVQAGTQLEVGRVGDTRLGRAAV